MRFYLGYFGDLPDFKECWAGYDAELEAADARCAYYYANPDYNVAAIIRDETTISFMAYAPNDFMWVEPGLHCCGAWTRPGYRRMGVYDTLVFCFTNQLRKQNRFDGMISGAHINNPISWQMQMKQGRTELQPDYADYKKSWLDLRPTGNEVQDIEPYVRELAKKFPRAA